MQALDIASECRWSPPWTRSQLGPRAQQHAKVYTDINRRTRRRPVHGNRGGSFDNAIAEAVNNLYKTELLRQRGTWRTIEQVELATLGVWRWNNSRFHGDLNMRTPIEVENAHYAYHEPGVPATAAQETGQELKPG